MNSSSGWILVEGVCRPRYILNETFGSLGATGAGAFVLEGPKADPSANRG